MDKLNKTKENIVTYFFRILALIICLLSFIVNTVILCSPWNEHAGISS